MVSTTHDYVAKHESEDYRDFFLIGEGFTKTPLYADFQGKLQAWVDKVAKVIRKPPKWDSKWMNSVWLDKPYEELPKPKALRAKKPKL